jgi:hypothetical protein
MHTVHTPICSIHTNKEELPNIAQINSYLAYILFRNRNLEFFKITMKSK